MQDTGGLPLIHAGVLLPNSVGTKGLTLLSDIHLGAANSDTGRVEAELKQALDSEDRILIGGDLFDFILPGDKKRFSPDVLAPRLQGRRDVVNAVLDWAEELLGPYAHLIDVVGCGNHETALENGSSFDAIQELCRRLRSVDLKANGICHGISHGSYQAFINYKLPKHDFVIWYHHGSGKSGKVYLELKKLMDQAQAFDADVYWSGHSHCRANCTEARISCAKGRIECRDVKCVITGSYLQAYQDQTQESIRTKGRKSNYAADAALRPHGLGGARLVLHFSGTEFPYVEVIQ